MLERHGLWNGMERSQRQADDLQAAGAAPNPSLPLEISALSYGIDGTPIIDGLDLRLTSSAPTVIMGPNGAGKSVLLRLIHGLLSPSSGAITWGGRGLRAGAAKRQAMVFQKPVLLRRSVRANLDFVLKLKGRRDPVERDTLLDLADLGDRADQPARVLSGGEQQRLALVRALALEPDVLLLDEPTASLDPASVLRIETILFNAIAAGTKVILVTHDVGQARRLANDIVFIHRGRCVEHAPTPVFFDAPESEAARGYLEGRIVL